MELQQSRLKLEVPLSGRASASCAELQCKYLSQSLQTSGILFDEVVQTGVEEPGCQGFLVYNYEIKSSSFAEQLLPAIRRFLQIIQEDARHIPHYLKATVIVHSPACFSKEVVSCHRLVPAAAIYFGNIQGGVYMNHWEVSFRNQNACEEMETNFARMYTDFLYDQSEAVCVSFYNEEWGVEPGEGRSSKVKGVAYYLVSVRLSFIRRIMVDNAVTDIRGRDRTRIHLELNCPVMIRRGFVKAKDNTISGHDFNYDVHYYRFCDIKRGRELGEIPHNLAISDSPLFSIELGESLSDKKIYSILSRLRLRTGISIEFASLHLVDSLYSTKKCPYGWWTANANEETNAVTRDFTMNAFIRETIRKTDVSLTERYVSDVVRERRFSLIYLIECLISRGAITKDQLLLDKATWITFLKLINYCYLQSREACLCAFERLITMIDERKRIASIITAYIHEYDVQRSYGAKATLSWQEIKDGYRKVRKLVITQTRVIYAVPETIMANRALRKYDHDGTRMIRITFRDDDNLTMRANRTSARLIRMTLKKYLMYGVLVAGRDFGYLGSSNSQMRDSGAYFLEKYSRAQRIEYNRIYGRNPPVTWQPKIDTARETLGRFTQIEGIPKLMARLGQCFTQTRKVDAPVRRENYITAYDCIGGTNGQGKEYTFTDGIGMISKTLAIDIAKEMQLDYCVPSCYQFRFRGMKGVVVVEPALDEVSSWAEKFNIKRPDTKFGSWDIKLVFRPSQIKFKAMRTATDSLEVVKYSSPVAVSLNKPFICILDQVSEMQSYECHSRVTNRIEELVDIQLRGLARTILREHDCRNKLKELPRRIVIDTLALITGFQLSTEPFFRSLIKASIKFTITKHMRKQQIQIPTDKGRTMFGVVDETGQLQYGQIFVQYTENINLKAPPPSALRRILTGKVLLTKNPCIVAGDVRVFNAVDIPELHHLCDVVVFPMHGPRPHPDEMAGSDLDGDEYAVIWDPELLLDRSEKPFNYTPEKPDVKPINKETMNADMIDFYVKYITQDSVGTISNSFLFQADLYGINSEVCQRLALKISQAVDFTKTGLPPAPLVREWSIDEDSGKEIPPEKSERRPDFHLGNDYDPTYRSPRLVGRIFREFKTVEDIVKISEDIDEEDEIECDKCLIVDGWSEYKEAAEARLAKYNGRLRSFMENYGVKTEGEIFSGCISEIRNRISDRDQDDMSLFNTTEVIEKKVTNLFREFREEFFEEFGGWQSCTQKIDARYAVGDNVFHRNSYRPTLKMRQKAVAYYRTCYERARVTRERMLSFAWIAYDVLAVVRRDNALEEEDIIHSSTPLHKMLKERVTDHCKINEAKLFSFTQFSNEEACCILQFYTRHYPGLNRLMFIICEWAERNRLFSVSLRRHHVCLILLLYATGQISGSSNRNRPLLDKVEDLRLSDSEPEKIVDDCQVELLVTFFEYLASRAFRKLRHISFSDLGYNSVLLCNQWKPLHEAAVRTYYNMAFNLKFDELNENQLTDPLRSVIIRECEPFVIEMPEDFDDSVVEKQIKLKTGVEEIRLRRLIYRGEGRVSVLARGTLASLRKLRNLLIIEPSTKTAIYGKEISAQLSRLTYENIIK